MGVYTNLLARTSVVEASAPRGATRHIAEWLKAQKAIFDQAVGTSYAAADAVGKIATFTGTPTSGNYTISIQLPNKEVTSLGITPAAVTTASIAFNATAATIETAIDVIMTASGPADWTNGDITVAEENAAGVNDGYITLTADGDSVTGMEMIVAITDVDLDTGSVGAVTYTTYGQGIRNATQLLFDWAIVTGTAPNQGTAPTDWTKPASLRKRPRVDVIQALALEAAIEDNTPGTYAAVAALYDFQSMGFTGE